MTTILIKGGLVYNGSGDEPVKQDILVRGDRIARLGNFSKRQAEKVIDATGAIITPGFIDINSAVDHYLDIFEEGWEENYIKQGITTVIGGNCGASLTPILGGALISLRKWTDISKLNINWHELSELCDHLKDKGLGLNFGTLIGHGTIRRALLGEETRDLTDREILTFKKILHRAFKDGAFGFSTGLDYAHSRSTPSYELEELTLVVAKENRVYATHLRDYNENLDNSLNETINLAKKTGVSVEISHLLPLKNFSQTYLKAKKKLEESSAELRINFDCYPSPYLSVPLYQLLPGWFKKENLEAMLVRLNSEHFEEKLLEHFQQVVNSEIYLCSPPPHLDFLSGKSLQEYASTNNLKPPKALLKLMRISHLRGVILQKIVDEKMLEDFIFSPSSFIASGEMRVARSQVSECAGRVFLKFLRLATNSGKISTEKAVAKLTSLPAAKYKIKDRGKLQEDYYADIVILKDLNPETVLINGKIVLEKENFKVGVNAGHILKYES